MPKYTKKEIEKFWSKVEKTKTCWNWIGYKNIKGYGRFWINKTTLMAHRLSYELSKGEIPTGLEIDHLCRNRSCVNPAHLEVVTYKENQLRGINTIINLQLSKTHCPKGHELKGDNLAYYELKYNWRRCKTCLRIRQCLYMRAYRQRKDK